MGVVFFFFYPFFLLFFHYFSLLPLKENKSIFLSCDIYTGALSKPSPLATAQYRTDNVKNPPAETNVSVTC